MATVRENRAASATVLHFVNANFVGTNHEFWHLANNPGNGLTDKEQAYLKKRVERLRTIQQEISKLTQRLQKTS